MKRSKLISSVLIIGSLALAPVLTVAQTPPPTPGGPAHMQPDPKVKKAKKKNPARPPHEDEKSSPSTTKEPPPPPIPPLEPHVPGKNPPPAPGSPPPESM